MIDVEDLHHFEAFAAEAIGAVPDPRATIPSPSRATPPPFQPGALSRGPVAVHSRTVSKILTRSQVRPHKISYYLERHDPEFEEKMAQVLCVYREVEALRAAGGTSIVAVLSYDEKPGIQALGGTAPDLPSVPGVDPNVRRDYQYVKHGTLTLMAGIDMLSGKVWGQVVERHRIQEFVEFLRRIDAGYPTQPTIRIVLDNHSAHVSRETRAFLATRSNRFEFVFTPKHGSWFNLIESFFSARWRAPLVRGIRVDSKAELAQRIQQYLDDLNRDPVVFRWRHKLDADAIVQATTGGVPVGAAPGIALVIWKSLY